MYKAYVTTLTNIRPHSNADRLQLGDCFGNTVCVSLDYTEGQIGLYFPTDGQLSIEFCEANNLVRKKDENGNNVGGYLDPDKRNVTAIRLRGEKSDGLFLPLTCLEPFGDTSTLKVGDAIDMFNGHLICNKYIPRTNRTNSTKTGNKTKKKTAPIAPLFMEHVDTEQLAYNLSEFKPGDEIEITLKAHGTSGRTAHLPVFKGYKRTLLDKLLKREGAPVYDWGYVSGTRRTVMTDFEGGYYGSDEFRKTHAQAFEEKLHKTETVYYEIVGYTTTGTPIMGDGNNAKLGKDFVKQYGSITRFSYGCSPDGELQSDIYVYRMTTTNEDGNVVEYTPDFMRYRCEQMGVKCVPVFEKFIIPSEDKLLSLGVTAGEYVKDKAEQYYDGPDPIGKTHVREGVVCRIINRPKFAAYKIKNFSFKVLEGIIKDAASVPDMEEAQEVVM